jgi:hypothetical protein
MYEVLRAKFAAEHSRDVGEGTTVVVTSKGKKDRVLSKQGHEYYDELLVPYKTPPLRVETSFLQLYDGEELSSSGEQQETTSDPRIPSPEQPGGSGASGSTSGDSTPSGGVPEGSSE